MAPGKTPKKGDGEKGHRGPYSRKSTGGATPSSAADDTSTPEDLKIDEDKLVEALSTRIEVPIYGIGTLRRYLEDADWVQNIAYDAFMADYRALRAGPTSPGIPDNTSEPREGLRANIREVPVVVHEHQEEQRREAMRLLRAIINIDRDPNNQINLTLTEAFFTLVLTGWDVEAAALRWTSKDVIRWQIHHTFDHLRTTANDQVGIDERTARFVHFIGRDDWHSVRAFLAAHNQRFMEAVRVWYRRGMPVVRTLGWNDPAGLYAGRRVTYEGQPRSPMPSDNNVIPMQVNADAWAPDETSFRPAAQPPNDPATQPQEDLRSTTKRKRGFCFTPEGDAPVVGGVMPQHFTVDYLQNGRYVANGFSWENWFRPELPESDDNQSTNPQFNEHAKDHIALLGKWIRQQHSRSEGTKKKPTPQEFSTEEKKYLFELCKRHLKKMLDENPGKTSNDFRPLEFRKGDAEKLEKDFNEAFEGKKPGSATEPRRHRKGTALKVKCGRMKRFRVAFGFKNSTKGNDDNDDDSTWSEDEVPPSSGQLPKAPLSIPSMTSRLLGLQRRQHNMAEERSIPDIDSRALAHRRHVRAQAEQHYIDNGILLPSEDQIGLQMRVILQAEYVNGKHTVHHAAAVRRLMRTMSMIVPEEPFADGDDEMEVDEETVEDTVDGKGGAETALTEQDDEIPDIDGLEFELEYFDEDVIGPHAE